MLGGELGDRREHSKRVAGEEHDVLRVGAQASAGRFVVLDCVRKEGREGGRKEGRKEGSADTESAGVRKDGSKKQKDEMHQTERAVTNQTYCGRSGS